MNETRDSLESITLEKFGVLALLTLGMGKALRNKIVIMVHLVVIILTLINFLYNINNVNHKLVIIRCSKYSKSATISSRYHLRVILGVGVVAAVATLAPSTGGKEW